MEYYNLNPMINIIRSLNRFKNDQGLYYLFDDVAEKIRIIDNDYLNELMSRQVFVILKSI
ncbi:MAG: hypothetical protein ACFFAS_05960 [Promethearchaeota archaeon]